MKIEEAKTVYKPWGKEVWLELNDKYCYKRIYINAGHRTSYQYHNHKIETNFLISGQAEVWLENDEGAVEKFIMNEGEFFNVTPPKKHRVIALTDIILQEVSTPEVDDVIRLQDDTNRVDGRLDHEHTKPAICIVAAGKGRRLGKLTNNFHKGLLPVDNKAVISHIIDKTPKDYDIIVAIGFNGNLIKEYCSMAHADRKITYVDVDNIDGKGSGPGYSLLKCKEHLLRPFYFTTVDCLIKDELPLLDNNWIGIADTSIPELYSTVKVDYEGVVKSFKNKSKKGYENAFIGLCAILDFEVFWDKLEANSEDGEMVTAFYDLNGYNPIKTKKLDWYDVGTIDNYNRAKENFFSGKQYGIPKESGEIVYKINGKFIKYKNNVTAVQQIQTRSEILDGLTPKITSDGNFYQYDWQEGNTLYDVGEENKFLDFLNWCKSNLWVEEDYDLSKHAITFYKNKTISRVDTYLKNNTNYLNYDKFKINGVECKSIISVLDGIDWEYLTLGIPTKLYHGDLQFDNVIHNSDTFKLIDLRPNFGTSVEYGDVYYDLAKLYGGILMSYKELKSDTAISISINDNIVDFSYTLPKELKSFLPKYEEWVISNGYDLDRIKLITALIFLNMSPLHTKTFGDMLFFKSIYMLNELCK